MDKRIGLLITAAAAAVGIVWFVRRGRSESGSSRSWDANTTSRMARLYQQARQLPNMSPATASTRQGESGASARAMTAHQRAQNAAAQATANIVDVSGDQQQAPLYTTV